MKENIITKTVATLVIILLMGASTATGKTSTTLLSDWEEQYADLQQQIAQKRSLAKTSANTSTLESQTFDRQALILDEDASPLDVALRRTRALIAQLKTMPGINDLSALEAQLHEIESKRFVLAKSSAEPNTNQDLELFNALAKVTRTAALENPLLNDFDDLLFVEWAALENDPGMKSREVGDSKDFDGGHMVDQQLGHNGHPNSRLYILKNFKTDNATLVDVTEGLQVPDGINQGMMMSDGAFSSPDLNFEGDSIVFAWASGKGWEKKFIKEHSFHVYKINIDGTGLKRLSEETKYDDFDPIWLPSGRIAFMSTRGSGNGRCHGRWAPTFTLHSMKSDGSDLFKMDWHETNEWTPSVDRDGKIVYSRWDYIDREDCIAHHLWTCFPDGRDPRAPHGNYPLPLTTMTGSNWSQGTHKRPYAETHIRAIPESHKYVAIAAPHHGQLWGSIVILDTRIEDDGVMAQVKRFTPDVPFPESETGFYKSSTWVYGSPWPLSEDFHIVNYWDGIYLLDKFGNRTLIYKTTRASYLRPMDPIPIKARTKPDIIPTQTFQGERLTANAPNASIYVNNVYVTDEFGTLPPEYGLEAGKKKIKWMRIIQVFGKTTDVKNEPDVAPHASESLVRIPLGVCPVEDDGSVYCEAPVEKEVYFQLLDEEGMAVQSMRSGTYVHPGEQLSCVGCHESKWESVPITPNPIAKRAGAAPAKLEPEVDPEHIWPFGFYRTAKPVLDEKCATCHSSQGGPDMSFGSIMHLLFGFVGDIWSMHSTPKWGGSRTKPGMFGAQYAGLTKYLDASHYDVNLTAIEKRRITLWLDLQSNELSAYHSVDAQKRGERIWPLLDIDTNNVQGVERRVVPINRHEQLQGVQSKSKAFVHGNKVAISFPVASSYTISVFSIAGKKIVSFHTKETKQSSFSTDSFKQGIYHITATSGSKIYVMNIFIGK
ncbi:MAG: hypothetical protein HQK83_16040 [Fibrobacteria bacterium]|nr:hypothetical protein [Fibrobacteria bacterium]